MTTDTELIEHLILAATRLREPNGGGGVVSAFATIIPAGVSLRTGGDARRGGKWWYLVMPTEWRPPDGQRWLGGRDGKGVWNTGWQPTEESALAEGIKHLLTCLYPIPR